MDAGLISGRMMKFEPGLDKGIIQSEDGEKYKFKASALSGNFPSLQSRPGVYFRLEDGVVTHVEHNPDAGPFKFEPSSGLALRGAQKCIKCSWRLPIIVDRGYKQVRSGKAINCPKCNQTMRLKSWFNGIHLILGGMFLLSIPIAFRVMRFQDVFYYDIFLLFAAIMIAGFFFVYGQGKFAPIEVDEVFE